MTKHRKPDEWIADILEAAAEEIDTRGYANLTMEGVAERAGLSKGGVYRFFASKQELAIALLRHVHSHGIDFDVSDVVAWGLPPMETLSRVLIVPATDHERASRDGRIWLQLLPQALWDATFAKEHRQLSQDYERKLSQLVERLIEREGVPLDEASRATVKQLVHIGLILRDGAALQAALGGVADAADTCQAFIHLGVSRVLDPGAGSA